MYKNYETITNKCCPECSSSNYIIEIAWEASRTGSSTLETGSCEDCDYKYEKKDEENNDYDTSEETEEGKYYDQPYSVWSESE